MGETRRWSAALVVGATVLAGLLPALSGCSHSGNGDTDSSSGPNTEQGTPSWTVRQAQDVCAAFVATMLSVDTATDDGPEDARRRAVAQYGADDLRASLEGTGRSHEFDMLAAHHAHVEVRVDAIGDDPRAAASPTTRNQPAAAVQARRTAVAADGWSTELPAMAAYCALGRNEDRLLVSAVTLSDAGVTPP
jgi:hypothetical protein